MNCGVKIGLVIFSILLIAIVSSLLLCPDILPDILIKIRSLKKEEQFEDNKKEEIIDDNPWKENKNDYGEMEILDDGNNGNNGLHFNLCSKACCSPQYPIPFKMNMDDLTLNSKQKVGTSNITCNNTMQDAGCMCITPEQMKFISNRCGNTS